MSRIAISPWAFAPWRIDLTHATAEQREEKMAAFAVAIDGGAHVRQETVGVYWIWTVAK